MQFIAIRRSLRCSRWRISLDRWAGLRDSWANFGSIQKSHPFSSDAIPSFLLPPAVFVGLLITLWTWKCLAMIVFQRKIIYMPGIPPFARQETISDYAKRCSGVEWKEERAKTVNGTNISLCVADTAVSSSDASSPAYVVYFQGNAGSMPMRLPLLSPVLRQLASEHGKGSGKHDVRYTIVCVSYSGYWRSQRRRPTEKRLAEDAEAGLNWIIEREKASRIGHRIPVVLWGQSLGCGVATNCAAQQFPSKRLDIRSIILETPFTSIQGMLVALYPQNWLPYRYLWPFIFDRFDSSDSLKRLSRNFSSQGACQPKVLILQAERDELVPPQHSEILEEEYSKVGKVERVVVREALHNEVMCRSQALEAVVKHLRKAFQ